MQIDGVDKKPAFSGLWANSYAVLLFSYPSLFSDDLAKKDIKDKTKYKPDSLATSH